MKILILLFSIFLIPKQTDQWLPADSHNFSWVRNQLITYTWIEQDRENRIYLKMSNGDLFVIKGNNLRVKRIRKR